ncbi:MAG TPA: hypothetical protein VI356_00145 [Myxococcales bacterium]
MTRALAALVLFAALPSQALTDRSDPYEFQVLVEGAPALTFRHEGETFLLGRIGERYTLRVINRSGRRVEAVVSVDGRDVIDGKPADWREKRGYLVPAWGSVDIDGWRISQQEAAAFRFSTVARSYAAQTGNAREVGVIGVAIFPERWVPPAPPVYRQPPAPYNGSLRDDSQRKSAAPRAEEGSGAAAQASPPTARSAERPGLGTEFGEAVSSQVREVPFHRARQRPDILLGARYDDREGLIALGIDVDGNRMTEARLRSSADPFPVVERDYAAPPPGWHR